MLARCAGLALLCLLSLTSVGEAHIGVSFGVHIPIGPTYYRPSCYHPCGFGRVYPIYRPVVPYYVTPVPYYYEPVPVPAIVASPRFEAPPPAPLPAPLPAVPPVLPQPQPQTLPQPIARASFTPIANGDDLATALVNVRHPDEKLRLDAVTALGRSASPHAIDALNAALARDPMPQIRDAAARALGVVGKPGGLNALRQAAASDPDPEVRRSAAYSVEVIQATLRGR